VHKRFCLQDTVLVEQILGKYLTSLPDGPDNTLNHHGKFLPPIDVFIWASFALWQINLIYFDQNFTYLTQHYLKSKKPQPKGSTKRVRVIDISSLPDIPLTSCHPLLPEVRHVCPFAFLFAA